MSAFLLRRIGQSAVLLLLVTAIAFGLMRLAPGGPESVYALSPGMRAEDLARIRASFGLDQPIPVQYAKWASGMLTGDWGRSYRDSRPVRDVIFDRIPATLELTTTALAFAVIVGVSIGVLGALRPHSFPDYLATVGAMLALAAALAAGVAELHRQRDGREAADHAHDVGQRRLVGVAVQAQVLRRDAALGADGRGLQDQQTGTRQRQVAQVHAVPVAGRAVLGAVLAHGRDHDAVGHRQAAERPGFEEA